MVFSMVLNTIPYHTIPYHNAMGMAVIKVRTFQTDLIRGVGYEYHQTQCYQTSPK
jgi:hypothetical protein